MPHKDPKVRKAYLEEYLKRPETIKRRKEYRERNREKSNSNHKIYYQNNKKKIDAKNKKWRAENRERANLYSIKWRKNNPEKVDRIISLIDEPVLSVTVPAKTQTYIAAKKPILAVIKGDVANIVEENNLGVIVSPSNIELIKDSLIKCIDMTDFEKRKFLDNSDTLLEKTFNKDVIINLLTATLVEGQEVK